MRRQPSRMLSAVHAFLLVFPLLQAGGARAQFAVNSDSLEQALPQERGALKRCGHYGGGHVEWSFRSLSGTIARTP